MAGVDGYGVQLQRSDMLGSPTFTAIANVSSLGGPEMERETYDVTAHDSPDGWREFVGGLKDGGEVSLEVYYDPDDHDFLIADFGDNNARDYKVVWPQGLGTWSFKAFMTGFSPEAPVDDKLAAEVTFKVTGKPVIT
ncbi:MAG: phage tail tube protein [Pseudonocardiaceae bacterium]